MGNKKSVQIGSGNIGRGLNAYILNKNNFDIIFFDISKSIVNKINSQDKYKIVELDQEKINEHTINNFSALNIIDEEEKCIKKIANSEIVFISIGITNLIQIKKLLAKSISKRINIKNMYPLNIVAIENGISATTKLKEYVFSELNEKEINYANEYIGFPDCSVDRIIPNQNNESLDIMVEPFYELVISKDKWKGKEIEHVIFNSKLEKYVQRKFFMLNATHSLIAWYGIKNNLKYICDFKNDENLFNIVVGLLNELSLILEHKFNFTKEDLLKYSKKIISRLSNKNIKDNVERVGRRVIDKISKNDRLLVPLNYAIKNGLQNKYILKAIALAFSNLKFNDDQAIKINEEIKNKDIKYLIRKYTSIENEEIIEKIKSYIY